MAVRIDAVRVAMDAAYAAQLSAADWYELSLTPEWGQLVAEQRELVANVLAVHGYKLPGFAAQVQQPPVTAPQGPFSVIGQPVPRVQGLGIVTGLGQYTQHITVGHELHMRTLRSPHPHARVRGLDTSEAEKLPGVVSILHRGNLPAEYQDVKLGSGPPDRELFNEEIFEVG